MKQSLRVFGVSGIDVRVHVTFVLIIAFGALLWARHGLAGALFGAGLMMAIFGCVLLHELGHAFAAQRLGLKVQEVVLFPLGGIASVIGTPRRLWHEVAIAAAGPLVNGVLAALFAGALALRGELSGLSSLAIPSQLPPSVPTLLLGLLGANVAMAVFNMLPLFPLDGGRILRALLSMRVGRRRGTEWAATVGQAGAVGMFVWSVLSLQILLGAVAVFLFLAAAQERRQVRLDPVLRALRAGDIAELPTAEVTRRSTIGDAARSLLKSSQRVLPVVDDSRVLGVLTRDDLLAAALDPDLNRQSVMKVAKPPLLVDASQDARSVLALLALRDPPAAVVMSDDTPLGLVTLPDALERAELWGALQPQVDGPSAGASLARSKAQS